MLSKLHTILGPRVGNALRGQCARAEEAYQIILHVVNYPGFYGALVFFLAGVVFTVLICLALLDLCALQYGLALHITKPVKPQTTGFSLIMSMGYGLVLHITKPVMPETTGSSLIMSTGYGLVLHITKPVMPETTGPSHAHGHPRLANEMKLHRKRVNEDMHGHQGSRGNSENHGSHANSDYRAGHAKRSMDRGAEAEEGGAVTELDPDLQRQQPLMLGMPRFAGVIYTIPASIWSRDRPVPNFPPHSEGPNAICHKWVACLGNNSILTLTPVLPQHAPEADELRTVPGKVTLDLQGSSIYLVRESMALGASPWWKRAPLELSHPDKELLYPGENTFFFLGDVSKASQLYQIFCNRVRETRTSISGSDRGASPNLPVSRGPSRIGRLIGWIPRFNFNRRGRSNLSHSSSVASNLGLLAEEASDPGLCRISDPDPVENLPSVSEDTPAIAGSRSVGESGPAIGGRRFGGESGLAIAGSRSGGESSPAIAGSRSGGESGPAIAGRRSRSGPAIAGSRSGDESVPLKAEVSGAGTTAAEEEEGGEEEDHFPDTLPPSASCPSGLSHLTQQRPIEGALAASGTAVQAVQEEPADAHGNRLLSHQISVTSFLSPATSVTTIQGGSTGSTRHHKAALSQQSLSGFCETSMGAHILPPTALGKQALVDKIAPASPTSHSSGAASLASRNLATHASPTSQASTSHSSGAAAVAAVASRNHATHVSPTLQAPTSHASRNLATHTSPTSHASTSHRSAVPCSGAADIVATNRGAGAGAADVVAGGRGPYSLHPPSYATSPTASSSGRAAHSPFAEVATGGALPKPSPWSAASSVSDMKTTSEAGSDFGLWPKPVMDPDLMDNLWSLPKSPK
eukprot:gene11303-18940_t